MVTIKAGIATAAGVSAGQQCCAIACPSIGLGTVTEYYRMLNGLVCLIMMHHMGFLWGAWGGSVGITCP